MPDFETKDNAAIAEIIENELKKDTSIIRKHSNFISSFFMEINTYTKLKTLVQKWKNSRDSKHTFEEIRIIKLAAGAKS